MAISESKSYFMENRFDEDTFLEVKSLFPFEVKSIDDGLKYLGYFLKPNNFLKEDWIWLVEKVEKRSGKWCNRWITMGEAIF